MKRSIPVEIGEGLFTSDPVEVEVELADHTAKFYMTALTQDSIAELARDGCKVDEISLKKMNEGQMVANARKLLAKFLHGWEGLKSVNGIEIPYTESNRDRIAGTELLGHLLEAAKDLGITRQEVEEKN